MRMFVQFWGKDDLNFYNQASELIADTFGDAEDIHVHNPLYMALVEDDIVIAVACLVVPGKSIESDPVFWNLTSFCVMEELQNQGVGSELMRHVQATVPHETIISLETFSKCVAWYEQFGFVRKGWMKDYYYISEHGFVLQWTKE